MVDLTVIAGQRESLEQAAIEAFHRNDMRLLGQILAALEPKARLRLILCDPDGQPHGAPGVPRGEGPPPE
jgi:hypothetical protein